MKSRFAVAVVLPMALTACEEGEARPQWLVWVGTDAPLPGFGDRIRIDVLDPDGSLCPSCSRTFEARAGAVEPLSFGVQPGTTDGRYLRARLSRAENTNADGDPEDPLIDVLAELPPLGETPISVSVVLGMGCFGRPASLASVTSCNPTTGRDEAWRYPEGDASSLPAQGSWGGGDRPCKKPTPPGMVCVPGGVFLMGSRSFVPFGPDFDPVPEQLVSVPAYFLDAAELDVGTARQRVEAGAKAPDTAASGDARCSYGEAADNDPLSVNCVDRETAALLCEVVGRRLPTEAEWEFAAIDRSTDASYPWVPSDEMTTKEICHVAIVARADVGDNEGSRQCILDIGAEAGPTAGSEADTSPLGIRDLGGNMSEWVSDDFARYSDPACWGTDVALRDDPLCIADETLGVVRGGSWNGFAYNSHGFFRRSAPSDSGWSFVGVRCAQDAE